MERCWASGQAGHSFVYEENIRIPLVIHAPGDLGAGREVAELARLIDVMPTVLELTGVQSADEMDGESLVPALRGEAGWRAPTTALSYAASSNDGLALRSSDGLKYVFRDAAWQEIHGHDRFHDLTTDPGETRDLTDHPSREAFLRNTRAAFEERASCLRVSLVNNTSRAVHGTLAGQPVTSKTVKSADLPCDCVSLAGPGEAAFRIPPASGYSLSLVNPVGDSLRLGVEPSGADAPRFSTVVPLQDLASGRRYELRQGAWRESDAAAPPSPAAEVALTFSWSGRILGRGEDAQGAVDEATKRQLEALGYAE
jgi:hypothetical protein